MEEQPFFHPLLVCRYRGELPLDYAFAIFSISSRTFLQFCVIEMDGI